MALHQQKLRQFPQSLPERVISPQALVMNQNGQRILGYTMPLLTHAEVLLRYCDLRRRVKDHCRRQVGRPSRKFQQAADTQAVVDLFLDLHETVSKLHFADVVIGDFNDLNILVQGTQAFVIDADSFQFGSFPCSVFTARFVDPLLCDPQGTQPILCRPYCWESDWYAFTVMLMQALLFVNPYGGVYKPSDPAQRLPQAARPLHRVTVFHPQVRYPKPALPCDRLPKPLLDHFRQVFEQDWRGVSAIAIGKFALAHLSVLWGGACSLYLSKLCEIRGNRPTDSARFGSSDNGSANGWSDFGGDVNGGAATVADLGGGTV
ncbi:hypothetical protein [Acaryochloris marina]|uniref:hypothetical protein n=1 Tax=Acaryochloris marina TaxID=155978 RepID=UPI0021C28D87|nr:hypothetical protein [Acaryochloris marina]BDM80062.1 hypothetical protein AM10699_29300 [Acaryochloris marina MBIC10699]